MTTVEISTPHSSHQVPEAKLTDLGLYVTAREAYEMWQADPERIKVLDVRTFEEYVLIGHSEMAANVPLQLGRQQGKLFDCDQYRFHRSCEWAFPARRYHPGHVPLWWPQRYGGQCVGQSWFYQGLQYHRWF